jgi:hypothetical protein
MWLSILILLSLSLPAQARNYVFPGNMPLGCTASGATYSCAALTLNDGDTIVIASPKPATINVTGSFNTSSARINANGAAADLNIVVSGALIMGYKGVVYANARAASIDLGIEAILGGTLNVTTGNVTLAYRASTGGTITSTTGNITLGEEVIINGNLSSTTGVISIGGRSTVHGRIGSTTGAIRLQQDILVKGSISASETGAIEVGYRGRMESVSGTTGGITLGEESTVTGSIASTTGDVTVGQKSVIGTGSITSTTGAIRLGQDVQVKGDLIAKETGLIAVGDRGRVGAISGTTGGVTVGENVTVGGGIASTTGPVMLGQQVSVAAGISSSTGSVSIGYQSQVCGGVSVAAGAIVTLGQEVKIGGSIDSTTGGVSLGYRGQVVGYIHSSTGSVRIAQEALVGGNIVASTGAVDVGYKARIGGSITTSTGAITLAAESKVNDSTLSVASVCAAGPGSGGSASAGGFDCLESSASWTADGRKPLYTKLLNVDFKVDLAALTSDGKAVASNYVAQGADAKNVKLELFDASVPAASCSAYANPVAAQQVVFSSVSAGRASSANFKVAAAYKALICRVKECADSSCSSFTSLAPACSSDQFSVRPLAATLLTNALGPSPAASSLPTFKAGANFQLAASTDAGTSYLGSLKLDTSKMTAQITSQDATQQSGGDVGVLTPSALASNGMAVNATYSEAGYLYLAPGAYRDDEFATVDIAYGDCLIGSQSNTLSDGKYGCNIGNQVQLSLGRFIPDHFAVTGATIANRSDLLACSASTFTYMGEPMTAMFTLTAQNAANGTARNYRGVFAKFNPATAMVAATSGVFKLGAVDGAVPRTPFPACGTTPAHPCITPGTASGAFAYGAAAITLPMTVYRGDAAVGPYMAFSVGIAPVDVDGVAPGVLDLDTVSLVAGTNNHAAIGTTAIRYGRLQVDNAYGSEKLNLGVKMTVQYWNGKGYAANTLDSCTPLPATNFSMSLWSGNRAGSPVRVGINASNMGLSHLIGSGAMAAGVGKIVLLKPDTPPALNINGSVTLNSLISYLPGSGRVAFGIDKSGPVIYIREVY